MQVAGEQRGSAQIVGADDACHPAFETDGESAVWRHPLTECSQVAQVGVEALAAARESGRIVRVAVQPLSAGDQFEAAEEQVEGVGAPGVLMA